MNIWSAWGCIHTVDLIGYSYMHKREPIHNIKILIVVGRTTEYR